MPPASAPPASYGVYIHAPWCRIRCPYCAFYVETDAPRWTAWAEGVLRHFSSERPHFEGAAEHLYFGGGTPSLCPPGVLGHLVSQIPRVEAAEVTAEANPGTVDRAMLDALVEAGVNRLSLGIQTFQPHLARILARAHTVADAGRLLGLVRETRGLRSWSADLIFAVPGETLDDLRDDLRRLIDSGAPHVSIYGLSFEPGTPLTRARALGRIQPPDESAWSDQYALVVETLEAAGLHRYEVSNFARPGHRALHNQHVWRAGHYLGLGPSAHGFRPDGTRTTGKADIEAWLAAPASGTETPTAHEAAIDLVLSTLRHRDGLPLTLLQRRTGHTLRLTQLAPFLQRRLLVHRSEEGREALCLGTEGWPVADGLVKAVVGALQPGADHIPHNT